MSHPLSRITQRLARMERELRGLATAPQLPASSFSDSALVQTTLVDSGMVDPLGNPILIEEAVARFGQQPDGSNTAVSLTGPVPPRPIGFTVTSGPGNIVVEWFGEFEDRIEPYADHDFVAIHLGASQGFTPIAATLVSSIRARQGERISVPAAPGTWYVTLVAVSQSGQWSEPAPYSSGEPGSAGGSAIDVTAREAAAAAQATADAAQADADTAQAASAAAAADAEVALLTADGKNRVTYGNAFPAGTPVYDVNLDLIGIDAPAPEDQDPPLRRGDLHYLMETGGTTVARLFQYDDTLNRWLVKVLDDQVLGSLTAGKITTGTLDTATVVRVGDTAADHLRLGNVPEEIDDGSGNSSIVYGPALQVMRPNGDGGLSPGIQIGGTYDRLQIIDPTGATLAGFDEQGNGTAQSLSAPYMELAGESIAELLWQLPRGVVAGFQATSTLAVNRPTVPAGPFAPLYEVAGYLQGGRIYKLSAEVTWYTSVAARAVLGFEITTDGTAPAGTSINSINPHGHYYATEGNRIQRGHLSTYFLTSYSRDVWTDVRAVLTAAVSTGNFYVQQVNAQDTSIRTYPYVVIEDCGPILSTGFMNQGSYRRTTGGTVTPPTGTTTKTVTLAATWDQVFRGGSVYGTTDLIQGASSWGNHRSMVGFNWNGLPAGSDVVKAEAYVYAWHWNLGAGGRMDFGIHSAASAPTTYSGSGSYVYPGSGYWGKGKGIWVTLPSAWNAQFTSGNAKGFVIGASGSASGVYYGKMYGVSSSVASIYKPQLRLTYTTS